MLFRSGLAVLAATVAAGFVAVFAQGELRGFSRVVFVLDGILLFLGTAALRFSFRVVHDRISASRVSTEYKRVLIYGAGDAGESLARALQGNLELQMHPVGFIDDDPSKEGCIVHGLPVFGPNTPMGECVQSLGAQEILISSRTIGDLRALELRAHLELLGVKVRRARWLLEEVVDGTPPPPQAAYRL